MRQGRLPAELTPTLYLAHEEEMYLWFQKHHPELSRERGR